MQMPLLINFTVAAGNKTLDSLPSVKIDQLFGAKMKFAFFYSGGRLYKALDNQRGNADGLPDPITSNTGIKTPNNLFRLNYEQTISPTVLLHFGAGFQWLDFGIPSVTADGSKLTNYNAAQALGLQGAILNKFFPPMSGLCVAGAPARSCTGQGG